MDNPLHAAWKEKTRIATEQLLRLQSQLLELKIDTPQQLEVFKIEVTIATFDIWAERGAATVWNDYLQAIFDEWLVTYAENCLQTQRTHGLSEDALYRLSALLMSRVAHWRAEIRTFRRAQDEAAVFTTGLTVAAPGQDRVASEAEILQHVNQQPSPSDVHRRSAEDTPGIFRRVDGGWEVSYGGYRCVIATTLRGMTIIHTLLKNPHQRISAAELLGRKVVGSGEPVLDSRAQREYKRDMQRLEDKLEIARDVGDQSRMFELAEEIAQIREALRKSTGLRSRPREVNSEADTARKAARKQYRLALQLLRANHVAVAEHLAKYLRSGYSFVYAPPDEDIWTTT